MTRINLYPWRLELEEHQKKQFFITLGSLSIVTFIIMIVISAGYSWSISNQEGNNSYLNNEIIVINKQLRELDELKSQKDALINKLSIIQEIEHDRYYTLNLFNEIVNLINPLIVLREVKRSDYMVKINGVAESNAEVAKFLRALEISPYFSSAQLNQIKVNQIVIDPVVQVQTQMSQNNKVTASNMNNISNSTKTEEAGLTHNFELQFYQNRLGMDKNKDHDVVDPEKVEPGKNA